MPKSQEVINAELNKDISFIKDSISAINEKLDKKYVGREEFEPVKRLVYGLVTLVLTGFVVALISVVITHT